MIDLNNRLARHLMSWVGEWPPPAQGISVVGHAARLRPTWDGSIRLLQGVGNGTATVIGVPPQFVEAVTEALAGGIDHPDLGDELGAILGVGPARFGAGVFRATTRVDDTISDTGEWHDHQTGDLPTWLAPFNGPRLVARDEGGSVIAGVGIKVHDKFGRELSVVTEEAARGQGLARRLVATAARRILADGAVPTYLHAPNNRASASVADAVGFVDRGWTVHGLWPRQREA